MTQNKNNKRPRKVRSAIAVNNSKLKRQRRKPLSRVAGINPRSGRLPTTAAGSTFVRAALDPFSDIRLSSAGVPDEFGGDTLKHVNTMEIVCQPDANGRLAFISLPSVSNPIVACTGKYTTSFPRFTGGTFMGLTSITRDPNLDYPTGTGIYPAIYWPNWAGDYTQPVATQKGTGPYSYRSQRILSQGLEWRYTGTELTSQGVCTAAIVDGYCLPGYLEARVATTSFATEVNYMRRAEVNQLTDISAPNLSNYPGYVQQTMKSADGAGGMTVHISAEEGYCLVPYASAEVMIDALADSAATVGGTSGYRSIVGWGYDTAPGLPVTQTGVVMAMSAWQNLRPVAYSFDGLDPTQNVVLKLKQYVEATVAVISPFEQFTSRSPAVDNKALALVADIQKSIPVMVPVTMNSFGDWWRKIMSTIGNVGRIVGGMGLPMVSQIAGGVSGITDILGSFSLI